MLFYFLNSEKINTMENPEKHHTTVGLRTGVFVDVSNIMLNGGHGMRYEVLRKFAERHGGQILRLNAYVSYDKMRVETDSDYHAGQMRFHAALRDLGYKVIIKEVRWYTDSDGHRVGKSNVDMDLAVDALAQSENLDRVILVTGDGDFVQVVRTLQNRGCRVETIAFSNSSSALRQESDLFLSGYLIPNLLPIKMQKDDAEWGELNTYVRGICISHDYMKNYGFFRYLLSAEGDLWRSDYRDPLCPYQTIFFHESELVDPNNIVQPNKMTQRKYVFEFRLSMGQDDQTKATDIHPIFAPF